MALQKIKRDDTVQVLAGKDRGKRGKVRRVLVREGKATVADINVAKRHQKPGRRGARQAGIIDLEAPIQLSNLAVVCPKCARPTRVGRRRLLNGPGARFCKRCGEQM